MSSFVEQLNLTPQERRIVVAIGLVVIVVLNMLFVWPQFKEWGKTQKQLAQNYVTLSNYYAEIALDNDPSNGLKRQLAKLEKVERDQGAAKPAVSEVQLDVTIRGLANKNEVRVDKSHVTTQSKPDDFWEEQTDLITILSQEPQLINFLYQLGNDPSMIRVRDLELHPVDQNRYKFGGTIVLTANIPKRPVAAPKPGKPAATPVKQPAGAKPPAAAGKLPNGLPDARPRPGGPPAPGHQPGANPRTIPNPMTPPAQNTGRKNL